MWNLILDQLIIKITIFHKSTENFPPIDAKNVQSRAFRLSLDLWFFDGKLSSECRIWQIIAGWESTS